MRFHHLAVLAVVAAISSSASAQWDPVTIQTRFGALKTNAAGELQFKGLTIKPVVTLPSDVYVVQTFKLKNADVVLVSQDMGTSCPGNFTYITVTAEGARATPTFGTCYDDTIQPSVVGETIVFTMKGLSGKGSSRYVYDRGVVFENGNPVK